MNPCLSLCPWKDLSKGMGCDFLDQRWRQQLGKALWGRSDWKRSNLCRSPNMGCNRTIIGPHNLSRPAVIQITMLRLCTLHLRSEPKDLQLHAICGHIDELRIIYWPSWDSSVVFHPNLFQSRHNMPSPFQDVTTHQQNIPTSFQKTPWFLQGIPYILPDLKNTKNISQKAPSRESAKCLVSGSGGRYLDEGIQHVEAFCASAAGSPGSPSGEPPAFLSKLPSKIGT